MLQLLHSDPNCYPPVPFWPYLDQNPFHLTSLQHYPYQLLTVSRTSPSRTSQSFHKKKTRLKNTCQYLKSINKEIVLIKFIYLSNSLRLLILQFEREAIGHQHKRKHKKRQNLHGKRVKILQYPRKILYSLHPGHLRILRIARLRRTEKSLEGE